MIYKKDYFVLLMPLISSITTKIIGHWEFQFSKIQYLIMHQDMSLIVLPSDQDYIDIT